MGGALKRTDAQVVDCTLSVCVGEVGSAHDLRMHIIAVIRSADAHAAVTQLPNQKCEQAKCAALKSGETVPPL